MDQPGLAGIVEGALDIGMIEATSMIGQTADDLIQLGADLLQFCDAGYLRSAFG